MNLQEIKINSNMGDVIDYVNDMFDEAISHNISDIHIEPTSEYILIRFRQDGEFILKDKLDAVNTSSLITRLKVLAQLKIDENKKPQDGKISYQSERLKQKIDIRLSTLPTNYGEKVALRVLKQDASLTDLEKLGFLDTNLAKIKGVLESKYGIILMAGPTGSGKSTTLFGLLKHFDPLKYNISTLEDPIEYDIDFVNQSQIKPEIGYTFASGLRSLVRQDPDIIMVGEIRDLETSKLSIEAALTGHLVLSTIHTNSASATIQRLTNMDIEPFLIASALKMVISQRLVKKICPHCKAIHNVDENIKNKIKEELADIIDPDEVDQIDFYKGTGCEECNGTGYKGRMGVHEVLVLDEALEKSILSKAPAQEIEKIARGEGMTTIVQDAILKAAMGETTVEEALKLG
ncbi:MAG: GspE/PulE family protein [Candidatus Gracilibacteria bacterium]|nr:GspE/PulE family protein [Candidatus Gracilibacteria bacterium]